MKNKDKVIIGNGDFDKFSATERKEKILVELNKKIKEQEVYLHQAERYSPEFFKRQKRFQELCNERDMLQGQILHLKYKNVGKKGKDKIVFILDDDFSKYKKAEVKNMSKEITTSKPETKKPETKKPVEKKQNNNLSQHRIEMFEKHKEDVRKMFKDKKRVGEINTFLKKKGVLQDMANYILLRLKLKTMGNVPEKAQIKKDLALVMAVNEKNKTPKKVEK